MSVNFVITDGTAPTPWLSPDIEPGRASPGSFTVTPTLTSGQRYDFRVTVHNSGTEDAVPWNDNNAIGDFLSPLTGSGGLAWTLSGPGRTIATAPAGGTRIQLVAAGGYYDLELQSITGATIRSIAFTLDPNNPDRRIGVVYSPSGDCLVALDYNNVSKSVAVSVYLAQAFGTLPAGTEIIGSGSSPMYDVFLPNLNFIGVWNDSHYAGLNFAFVPLERSLLLVWTSSTGDSVYAVLDLREKPYSSNRISITNLPRPNVGQHLFSPGGDLFALIPSNIGAIELFELPSGQSFPITYNGNGAGQLNLVTLAGKLSVIDPTAYGGIALTNITNNLPNANAIDPPFRARCAVQVHFWATTPAGTLNENDPANIKLPANVNKQGASAYIGRVDRTNPADVIVIAQYQAPTLAANDHRCTFAEAYSVAGANPFQGKQRTGSAFNPLSYGQVAQRNLIIVPPNSPFYLTPYVVANYGEKQLDVKVTIEQIDPLKLPRIRPLDKVIKFDQPKVRGWGFIEYPCGQLIGRDEVKQQPSLKLTLQPGERHSYAMLVDVVNEPDPKRLELAAFNIIEQRSDGTAGGVTVLTASNPDLILASVIAETPDACPVDLVVDPYWCESPRSGAPGRQTVIPGNRSGYLAAEFVNKSALAIDDLEIWVESHAIPETRIDPLVFQARRLEPAEKMFAAWPIETGNFPTKRFPISIVGKSPKHSPHRIFPTVLVSERGG